MHSTVGWAGCFPAVWANRFARCGHSRPVPGVIMVIKASGRNIATIGDIPARLSPVLGGWVS